MQGVPRNEVRLSPPSEDWVREYEQVRNRLAELLGHRLLRIEHVGSTAIRSVPAKPILDVAVVVRRFEDLPLEALQKLGYEDCGEAGVSGRRLFVLRSGDNRSLHHIHCYRPGNENLKAVLLFRDYLSRHPEEAKAYGELKQCLAVRYPRDRVRYTREKEPFIQRIVGLAEREEG